VGINSWLLWFQASFLRVKKKLLVFLKLCGGRSVGLIHFILEVCLSLMCAYVLMLVVCPFCLLGVVEASCTCLIGTFWGLTLVFDQGLWVYVDNMNWTSCSVLTLWSDPSFSWIRLPIWFVMVVIWESWVLQWIRQAKDAIKTIKRRLTNRNPMVQLLALTVCILACFPGAWATYFYGWVSGWNLFA
jgi:hypothetical protein